MDQRVSRGRNRNQNHGSTGRRRGAMEGEMASLRGAQCTAQEPWCRPEKSNVCISYLLVLSPCTPHSNVRYPTVTSANGGRCHLMQFHPSYPAELSTLGCTPVRVVTERRSSESLKVAPSYHNIGFLWWQIPVPHSERNNLSATLTMLSMIDSSIHRLISYSCIQYLIH